MVSQELIIYPYRQAGILGHGYRKALHTNEAGLRHIVTVPIKTRSRIPCTNCANQRHLFINYTTYTVHTQTSSKGPDT